MEIDTIDEYKENKNIFKNKIEFLEKEALRIKEGEDIFEEISLIKILKGNYSMIFKNKIAKSIINKIIIDGKKRKMTIYFNI